MRLLFAHDALRLGFTKIELFVAVSIAGILMALLIPAVNDTRYSGHRRNQCSTQLNNLSKAAIQYEMAKKRFPGYMNDFGTYVGTTDPSNPAETGGIY